MTVTMGGCLDAQSQKKWNHGLALVLCVFSCAVYLVMPQPANPNAGDNFWYVPTAMSLVHEGDLDISEFADNVRAMDPADIWINCIYKDPRLIQVAGRGSDDRRLNRFPIGTSLFAVPFVVVSDWVLGLPPAPLERAAKVAAVAAATSAALAVLLMFYLVSRLTSKRWLVWSVALFYAFGSPHFSTHHSALWSHNVLQLFVLMPLLLLVVAGGRMAWLSALPLTAAYVTRPESVIFVAAYAALMVTRPKQRLAFFGVLGFALIGLLLWSHALYGTYTPPYYYQTASLQFSVTRARLLGTLVSPNRGVFVFAPVLVLAIPGALLAVFRHERFPAIYRLAAAVVTAHWILLAGLPWWWGGFSVGPRYFLTVLPLLVVLVVPGLEWAVQLRGWAKPFARGLIVAAAVWSLFVQIRISSSSGPHDWNYEPNVDLHPEQVWNWSDLQILRRPRPTPYILPRITDCP